MRVTCLIITISCYMVSSALAAAHSKPTNVNIEQLRYVRQLLKEADNTLYTQMETVSDWLENYKAQNKHFPEPGVEQEDFKQKLRKLIPHNPYKDKQEAEATNACLSSPLVQIVFDGALSEAAISLWRQQPPKIWHAAPGEITAITNGEDLILVWGAAVDGTPLKEVDSSFTKFVIRRINQK